MSDKGNNRESVATRGLSAEDVEDFQEAFDNFDQDKDGSIDPTELATALRSLGYTPTKVQLKKVMDKVRTLATRAMHFEMRFGPAGRESFFFAKGLECDCLQGLYPVPCVWGFRSNGVIFLTLDTVKAR